MRKSMMNELRSQSFVFREEEVKQWANAMENSRKLKDEYERVRCFVSSILITLAFLTLSIMCLRHPTRRESASNPDWTTFERLEQVSPVFRAPESRTMTGEKIQVSPVYQGESQSPI